MAQFSTNLKMNTVPFLVLLFLLPCWTSKVLALTTPSLTRLQYSSGATMIETATEPRNINKRENIKTDTDIFTQSRIQVAFNQAKAKNEAAFVAYLTAGYPNKEATPTLLKAMQDGGASIIELGVPYSDPQADGPTIQQANQVALQQGTSSVHDCLNMVQQARQKWGLTVPVLLMGYYNPFFQHRSGVNELCRNAQQAGVDGFIVADLPPDCPEGSNFQQACKAHGLANVPLVAPTTSDERLAFLAQTTNSNTAPTFWYCVSVNGVTGARKSLPKNLDGFLQRVKSHTKAPLSVGFGISNPQMVHGVAQMADGVVVGSAIVKALQDIDGCQVTLLEQEKAVRETVSNFCTGLSKSSNSPNQLAQLGQKITPNQEKTDHDNSFESNMSIMGEFGSWGGQYIPETLSQAFSRMEKAYQQTKNDPAFLEELEVLSHDLIGSNTPLQVSQELTDLAQGATIWLKHQYLVLPHVGGRGSSTIMHNTLGQALFAKRLGIKRIIADAVQFSDSAAVALVCRRLGMDCTIYMGSKTTKDNQSLFNKIRSLGADLVVIPGGTIKDSMNEAMRDVVTNVETSYYLVGSAVGPHPFPTIVRDFQKALGKEIKQQFYKATNGSLPDAVVASVGRDSNAIGAFYPFLQDYRVALHGVEGVGKGLHIKGGHCAVLAQGSRGIFHGSRTYLLQDESGQTLDTHSIADGLNYPAIGPEHAHLYDIGRAKYTAVTDTEALEAFQWMSKRADGIVPSLEASHAIYHAVKLAKTLGPGKNVVVSVV